jgi:D-alanyl-D-alanine carboxypeptidase
MCRFLAGIRRLPFADAFEQGLPVLGCDGTLHEVQARSSAAAARAIRAKTGTMGYEDKITGGAMVTAKALAGYMTTKHGSELAFAAFATNVPASIEDAGGLLGEIAVAAYEAF